MKFDGQEKMCVGIVMDHQEKASFLLVVHGIVSVHVLVYMLGKETRDHGLLDRYDCLVVPVMIWDPTVTKLWAWVCFILLRFLDRLAL